MKILALAFLSIIASRSIEAGPLDWLKRQFRDHPTRTAFVIGGIAAGVDAAGLAHCREGDVEHCRAKYGEAWASYGFTTGLNFTMIAVSDSCGKNDGGKFCNIFRYAGSGAQAGFGISQWRAYAPKKEVSTGLKIKPLWLSEFVRR